MTKKNSSLFNIYADATPPVADNVQVTRSTPFRLCHLSLWLSLLVDFTLSGPALAQVPMDPAANQFLQESWTVEDGLPVNSATGIIRTPGGYIWMSTFDGLVRFDGVRFIVLNAGNTAALPSNRLIHIANGPGSSFWLTTEQRHILRVDSGQVTNIGSLPTPPTFIYPDGDSLVWIGSEQGLYIYREDRLERYPDEPLKSATIHDLLRDRKDALWVATGEKGVWHFTGRKGVLVPTPGEMDVTVLYEDRDRVFWAGGSEGVARLHGKGFEPFIPNGAPWGAPGWEPSSMSVKGFFRQKHGVLWIATTEGLFQYDEMHLIPLDPDYGQVWEHHITSCTDDRLWISVDNRLYRDGSLMQTFPYNISSLFCDTDESLWVTTHGSGLYRYRVPLFHTYSVEEGLGFANVYHVYQDRKGTLWFAGIGNELTRYEAGVFHHYTEEHVPSVDHAIYEDHSGNLWVGSALCRVESQPCSRFEPVPQLQGIGEVIAIDQSREGTLWFGSTGGLSSLRDGQWHHFTTDDGLSSNHVRFILETSDGSLWLATLDGGIMRYRDGHFTALTMDDGLSSNHVRSLYEDEDGVLWIGTEDRGLNRLDLKSPLEKAPLTVIRQSDGLFDDVIHMIIEDDAGRLWMSTNRGIFWVHRKALNEFANGESKRIVSTYYTERDGMRIREANGGRQDSGLKASDRRLWFATQNGVVVVDPATITEDESPPVVIEEIVMGDMVIPVSEDQPISLTAGQRNLSVRYTGLKFVTPEQMQFRYRLEGLETDWTEAGNRREAFYTHLPPGRYTFRVSASSSGNWNQREARLTLTVAPFFYETWWFLVLCTFGVGLFVFGGFRYRIRQLRRREAALSALVAERTEALQAEKRKTEEQAARLVALDMAKSRFFANISHEFRTPLTLTLGSLEDLRAGVYGAQSSAAVEQLGLALRNSRRLLRLVGQLLDLARLETGQFRLNLLPGDLGTYLRTLAQPFVAAAERQHVSFVVEIPPEPVMVHFDPEHFDKIVANLLSNAIKFTPEGGHVVLSLQQTGDHADVVVTDTGRGIPPEHLAHLFERFFQGEKSEMQPGTGIGLSLAKELAELHGGAITVKSEVGLGSVFTLMLPLTGATDTVGISAEAIPIVLPAVSVHAGEMHAEGTVPFNAWETTPEGLGEDITTILVVDDNSDIRAYVRRHLEGGQSSASRYHVVEAADGAEALNAIHVRLPDLIVSDVVMPRLDGFALLEVLRTDPETDFVPVILLTARAEAEDRLTGLDLGADDYLTKPFDARELGARVDNLITQRRRLRERFAVSINGNKKPSLHAEAVNVMSADASFLESVRTAIEAHLSNEDFGVEALADSVGQSRSNLHRRLTDLLGESPSALLRRMRLERGADLLRQQIGTVSEVAYAVGFKSVAHFSASFSRHFGCSPTMYAGTPIDTHRGNGDRVTSA